MTDSPTTESPHRLQLRYSPTSPFVRKVMVVAHETGVIDRIDILPTDVWSPHSDVRDDTPLGKIPSLLFPDGRALAESTLICDVLDRLHDGPRLFPDGEHRLDALRWLALGDGLLNAAVVRIIEGRYRRADDGQAWWIERQMASIRASLRVLERELPLLEAAPLSVGTLTVAVALAYLSFRFPQDQWEAHHPALAQWQAQIAARPAMVATQPPAA